MKTVSACLLVIVVIASHQTSARILSHCDLARELRNQGVPNEELSDWVCIAQGESSMNTAAINKVNTDGSWDYGLFQINNRYWCGSGHNGGGCNVNCDNLINDDISDDIRCVRHIKQVQGFGAWVAWNNKCNGKPKPDVSGC